MSDQPGGGERREVYIRRGADGRFLGYSASWSGGRFISRSEAIPYLQLDAERGVVVDSVGNTAGIGAVTYPRSGVEVQFVQRRARYMPTDQMPDRIRPGANQEIIERQVLVGADGKLVEIETSYGLGQRYDPSKRGGWWRQKASQALGLAEGQRLATRDLEKVIVSRQFLIKTTT